jgi:hypothetical protein
MKLKIKCFVIFLSGLFLYSCDENPVSNTSKYENEKYNVYSTIINSKYTQGSIFIYDTTASGYWFTYREPSYLPEAIPIIIPALKPETIEIYKNINQTRTALENKFNLLIDYELISPGEAINSSNFIIIDFTNVAFDKQYTQSLVFLGTITRTGGIGSFIYLEKYENNWEIKGSMNPWPIR